MAVPYRKLLSILAGASLGCSVTMSGPAFAACSSQKLKEGVVEQVIDAATLQLDDGSKVRLVGALPPQTPPWWKEKRDWPPGTSAKNLLEKLVAGKKVILRVDPAEPERDRHDRFLAQVHVLNGVEETWVQGEMINAGFARTYSFPAHKSCARNLLAREDSARRGMRGLWRAGHFKVFDAGKVETLMKQRGEFVLVEGLVVSVGKTRNWTYLNFSRDWRTDFTVSIASGNRKNFEDHDMPLAMLEGKRVRVRGWIGRWNGPVIKADHAEQIELLP